MQHAAAQLSCKLDGRNAVCGRTWAGDDVRHASETQSGGGGSQCAAIREVAASQPGIRKRVTSKREEGSGGQEQQWRAT